MLKVAETPTWTQMVHIYDRLLYILYPSLCKSWFPACDKYSINYSTLSSNIFPLLFLNVASDWIASLPYLQRIHNLRMQCIRLHGYQISVNGTQSEKSIEEKLNFAHSFNSGPCHPDPFFPPTFSIPGCVGQGSWHTSCNRQPMYQDHRKSCLYLFDCSVSINPWKQAAARNEAVKKSKFYFGKL